MKYIILILSLIFLSCQEPLGLEENVRETIQYESIIPLSVGNEWVYRITEYDEHYNQIDEFHNTIRITDRHEVAGEFWYRVHDDFVNEVYFYSYRNDGLYIKKGDIAAQAVLYFQYPTEIGNEYSLHEPVEIDGSTLHTFRKVMNYGVEAYSPLGTYSAIQYNDDYRADLNTLIFDPIVVHLFNKNVGLVRAHINEVNSNYTGVYLKYAKELVSINF